MTKFKYHGRLITASTKEAAIRSIIRKATAGKQYMDKTLGKVKTFLEGMGCSTEWQHGITEDGGDDIYDAFCFNFPGEDEGWNTVEIYRNGTLGASVNDGEDYVSGKTLEQVKAWLKNKAESHA